MEPVSPSPNFAERRNCVTCGQVVGVYEPAAFSFTDEVVLSSLAARPELLQIAGCSLMHIDCFSRGAQTQIA